VPGVESKNKKLRSGYTTGACAAAAAKAAAILVLRNAGCGMRNGSNIESVEIPFPDGSRVIFKVFDSGYGAEKKTAFASVIKDAGDDPDITNGAEVVATVQSSVSGVQSAECPEITIRGGKGVGTVTKPGLAIPIGEPAVNPVPRRMIREAVT
jgi:cobalt-precorrin-5B (C1)-methyltransferase